AARHHCPRGLHRRHPLGWTRIWRARWHPATAGGGGMERNQSQHLSVEVQLMTEPCLWRWEIRDRVRGEIVDSSWTREWMAYESPEEALHAGRQRLTSLIRR